MKGNKKFFPPHFLESLNSHSSAFINRSLQGNSIANPKFQCTERRSDTYNLFCDAYGMERVYEIDPDYTHEEVKKYQHFLEQQKPFIDHIKKLLPAIGDGRWNPCLHTLEEILIWNENRRDTLYFNVFNQCLGILLDFFHETTIAGRIENSSYSFVALLELDKALVNAYYRACELPQYLSFCERNFACRTDLYSKEFKRDLIKFIEDWQQLIQFYYPIIKNVANVSSESIAYAQAKTVAKDNPIGVVKLLPGAVEKLYAGIADKHFVPLRNYDREFSFSQNKTTTLFGSTSFITEPTDHQIKEANRERDLGVTPFS